MTKSLCLVCALAAFSVTACGGDDGGASEFHTDAPACSSLQGGSAKELFPDPVVPTESVEESLIFGGMDPGTLEPINFELGFLLNDINVPVTAPVDLYVRSMGSNSYMGGLRNGEKDFQIVFDVCSDDAQNVAVEGDFAHITSMSSTIQAILDGAEQQCDTNTGPEESVEQCRAFFNDETVVIPAGTNIGSAGGTGLTDYAPGFDFNLLDTRFPNEYVNPDRIGAETGPGRGFRYGACVYEYFSEPTRSAYLGAVGQGGDHRVSATSPCGSLSIGEAGTAAGVWIRSDKAELAINDNLVEVLEHLLVLAPHPVFPEEKQIVSTEMDELSELDGDNRLMQFEIAATGDVNVSFYDMVAGPVYCVSTYPFGVSGSAYYLIQLDEGGATLKLERVDSDCSELSQGARAFSASAVEFVR